MAKYKVTAKLNDGSFENKVLNLPSNYEEAECEAECHFENLYVIESMERI